VRQISFALTTAQFRARTKRVTRRLDRGPRGWRRTRPRELLQGIVKGQGLKKGEHVERLGVIFVERVTLERLDRLLYPDAYGAAEVILEGFPELTPAEFVALFCKHNRCRQGARVVRIAYDYLATMEAST
jgi:hypothetical protein